MSKSKPVPKSLTRRFLLAFGIPVVFIPGLILAGVLGWDWQSGLTQLKQMGVVSRVETVLPHQARSEQVIDGDTIELSDGQRVRLQGINAPELREVWGKEAKQFVQEKVGNQQIELEYDSKLFDSYGRLLAYVWVEEQMLNELLLQEGLAKYYPIKGEKTLKYDLLLKKAEQYAQNHHYGLWYRAW